MTEDELIRLLTKDSAGKFRLIGAEQASLEKTLSAIAGDDSLFRITKNLLALADALGGELESPAGQEDVASLLPPLLERLGKMARQLGSGGPERIADLSRLTKKLQSALAGSGPRTDGLAPRPKSGVGLRRR